jgi:hypothetical protein
MLKHLIRINYLSLLCVISFTAVCQAWICQFCNVVQLFALLLAPITLRLNITNDIILYIYFSSQFHLLKYFIQSNYVHDFIICC